MFSSVITWCWITLTDSLIHLHVALFCKDKQQTMIRQELFKPLYQCPHGWLWQYLRSSLLHRNSSSSHWSSLLCGWVFQLCGGKCRLWGSLSLQRQRRRGSCNVLHYGDWIEFGCIHVNEVHRLIAATKLPIDRQVAWKRILLEKRCFNN